jgi:hypothetical protein
MLPKRPHEVPEMQLEEVVPWGRSLDEYRRMFALAPADLTGRRFLGCADGPASFNAEATALGHAIVSCDPVYAFSAQQICQRVEACYETIVAQARHKAHRYIWKEFPDADALGRSRLATMRRFLDDFETGRAAGRYVAGSLPHLPFGDRAFDLCLCSHLLFLYSRQFDLRFHLASAREMLRVAGEVRIFPLLDLDGEPSPHVAPLTAALRSEGRRARIEKVPYEFQRGGDRMMVLAP